MIHKTSDLTSKCRLQSKEDTFGSVGEGTRVPAGTLGPVANIASEMMTPFIASLFLSGLTFPSEEGT